MPSTFLECRRENAESGLVFGNPDHFGKRFLYRPVGGELMPQIRKIQRDAKKDNYTFASLIMGVVNSDAFRKQAVPAKAAPQVVTKAAAPAAAEKLPTASAVKAATARSGAAAVQGKSK